MMDFFASRVILMDVNWSSYLSLVDRCTKATWKQEHGTWRTSLRSMANFRFFRMQKELLSNEFNQSGCIQNDPVLHKLFEDAIAVLRLAGADDNSVGKN